MSQSPCPAARRIASLFQPAASVGRFFTVANGAVAAAAAEPPSAA